MQIRKLTHILLILLLSGCASSRGAQAPARIAEVPQPHLAPVVMPASGPLGQPVIPSYSVPTQAPVKWTYKSTWKWTDRNFPHPGDSVKIFREAGVYFSGTVLKSTAKTEPGGITNLTLLLDGDGNGKADARAELIIEDSKVRSRIRTSFEELAEK